MTINKKNLTTLTNIVLLLLIGLVLFKFYDFNYESSDYITKDPQIEMAAQKMATDCENGNRAKCYESAFKQIITDHNFSFAEQTLFALQDTDPMMKSCHVIAHFISRTAVRKDPENWLSILDQVNVNACGSGFLHGALESHLGDDPDAEFNAALSEEVCNRGDDGYRKRMCTHFMGHFFVVGANDNLDKATLECEGVSEQLKFDCFNGLFMEHNQRIALVDHKLASPPVYTPAYAKSLEKVCLKYSNESVKASACFTELAEVYAKTFGYDAKLIYDHCYGQNDDRYAENCYGKGQTILSTDPRDLSVIQLTDICKFYKNEYTYKGCLTNIISSLMYYSPKYTERGLILCQNIPNYQEWCVTELGNKLSQFVSSKKERLTFCQSAKDENYKNLCAKID